MSSGGTDIMMDAGDRSAGVPASDVVVGGLPGAKLRRVTAYIEGNLHRPLRLAELALVAHMSPYHFARLFKTATGLPPHRFVVHRRIDAAAALLTGSRSSIGVIARKVGFTTASQFATAFRRVRGLTPTQYRAGRALGPTRADMSSADSLTAAPCLADQS
jgi:AraC-like DNA-binding protein